MLAKAWLIKCNLSDITEVPQFAEASRILEQEKNDFI